MDGPTYDSDWCDVYVSSSGGVYILCSMSGEAPLWPDAKTAAADLRAAADALDPPTTNPVLDELMGEAARESNRQFAIRKEAQLADQMRVPDERKNP